jgi:plasmid stability protein
MPVNLSIKNVPDKLVERLRRRAAEHHRSLQGELMAIIEASVRAEKTLMPHEVLQVRRLGLRTPSAFVSMIRRDRNVPNATVSDKLGELLDLLQELPSLGDDASTFARDVERGIRRAPGLPKRTAWG